MPCQDLPFFDMIENKDAAMLESPKDAAMLESPKDAALLDFPLLDPSRKADGLLGFSFIHFLSY